MQLQTSMAEMKLLDIITFKDDLYHQSSLFVYVFGLEVWYGLVNTQILQVYGLEKKVKEMGYKT